MAHIYLCKPQSLVRPLSPSRSNTYLDDILHQTRICGVFPSYTALIAAAGNDIASRPGAVRQPPPLPQPLTEQHEHTGDYAQAPNAICVAAHRSPSAPLVVEDGVMLQPPPPYAEVQASPHRESCDVPQPMREEASASRDRTVEYVNEFLHVHTHPLAPQPPPPSLPSPAPPPQPPVVVEAAANAGGESPSYGAAMSPKPPVVLQANNKKGRRSRQTTSQQRDAPSRPLATSAVCESNAHGEVPSSLAYAQRFLVEYEALSRRDIIIDYYAAFPPPPAPASGVGGEVPSATTSRSPLRNRQPPAPSVTAPFAKKRGKRPKPTRDGFVSASRHSCRLVFPGSLWDAVLRHHRKFLQHALIHDVEAALPATSVDVISLHTSATELEAILSVKEINPRRRVNADAVLQECGFDGVWETYNFVSSVLIGNGNSQHPLPSLATPPAPPLPRPLPPAQFRTRANEEEQEKGVEEGGVAQNQASPSPRTASRVGGAPWRQTRQQANRRGEAPSTQSELVVPIVFATSVTNKLRRAARSGTSGDLHVALRRDGLYAVPSAKEVRVRATRVNADGLYVELVFRWQEGDEVEENAEEAMADAPFTDTWKYLEECQPPTTTSVLSTVVKREASTVRQTAAATPRQQEQRYQQQPQQRSPPSQPVRRVGAGTATRTETSPSSSSTRYSVKMFNMMCEVPLPTPLMAANEPNVSRGALRADIARLPMEAVSEAQISIGSPQTSTDGNSSVGFEVDAVPKRVARSVRAASFPQSFPHLARLSPTVPRAAAMGVAARTPVPHRATVGTSMTSLTRSASQVSERSSETDNVAAAEQEMPQVPPAALLSPLDGGDNTVSEVFSVSDDARPASLICAATQTSFTVSSSSTLVVSARVRTPSRVTSSVFSDSSSGVISPEQQQQQRESRCSHVTSESSGATSQVAPLPVLFAVEAVSPQALVAAVALHASESEPSVADEEVDGNGHVAEAGGSAESAESPHSTASSASSEDGNEESEDEGSVQPVAVARGRVRSYVQIEDGRGTSLPSLEVTEAVPGVPVAAPTELKYSVQSPRLTFSILGEKWAALLEEYPVLLKRALQADVQDLCSVPLSALGNVDITYDDRLRVVVVVDPDVTLKPMAAASAAMLSIGDGSDTTLPVERLPHAWSLYNRQAQQHFLPAAESSKPPFAFSFTRRPKESPILCRQPTDSRAVLNGSIRTVKLNPVESLLSPVSAVGDSRSISRSSVVSVYQIELPGTLWNTLLAHRRDEVTAAVMADVEELLADQLAQLTLEDITVQEDGRLRVDFGVPLVALPCGLNPPQFRWALERLPLTHLRELQSTAASHVPTTAQISRVFDVPALREDVIQQEEATIRTLFVSETCALVDTTDDNVLRLTVSGNLTIGVVMRVPMQSVAKAWQKALMEYRYPALIDFLREVATRETLPNPLSADAMRRATLLSSSSLMVTSPAKESTQANVTTSPATVDSSSSSSSTCTNAKEDSSSAHAVYLEGLLCPRLLEEHAVELHEAVLSDAALTLSPLSVSVEQLVPTVQSHGVLFTFLLRGLSSPTNLQDVENALQSCAFTKARALYTRLQTELDEEVKMEARRAAEYAMQLDGEAWLEVLEKHKQRLRDTFALEALTCLRGSDAIKVPVGVAVKTVVPKGTGVAISYDVVSSSAAADAADRVHVAEVLGQYPFPLLWGLYDEVMLSREPLKHTINRNWITARRQRLLNTAYTAAGEPPDSRSYSIIGYTDEMDLEEYLLHYSPNAPAGDPGCAATAAATSSGSASPLSITAESPAGHEEYDFRYLPAPSSQSSSTTTHTTPQLPRLVALEVSPPPPQPRVLVAPQLGANVAAATSTQPSTVSLPPPPPLPPQETDKAPVQQQLQVTRPHTPTPSPKPQPAAQQPEQQQPQQQQSEHDTPNPCTPLAASQVDEKSTLRELVRRISEQCRVNKDALRARTATASYSSSDEEETDETEEEVVAENEVDDSSSITEDDEESAHVSPLRPSPPPNNGGGAVDHTLLVPQTTPVMPRRPLDIKPVPAPSHAKAVIHILTSEPAVFSRPTPAPPSRAKVDVPELTSAKQIEAPVRLRSRHPSNAGEDRQLKNAPPVPDVARQSHPTKVASSLRPSAAQKEPLLPRMGGSTITSHHEEHRDEKASSSSNEAKLAVQRSPASPYTPRGDVAAPVPVLHLPPMGQHSAAPITVVDVRMTHPPLAVPLVVSPHAGVVGTRTEPVLSAGVSLASSSQLSSRSRNATPRAHRPSKVAESTPPALPVLYASVTSPPCSTLTLPPTNLPQSSTAPVGETSCSATPATQSSGATSPATEPPVRVVKHSMLARPGPAAPPLQRQLQLHSPLPGPRAAGEVQMKSVKMIHDTDSPAPPRQTPSSSSSSPPPPQLPRLHPSVKHTDATQAAVVKRAPSTSPPDVLSDGPTGSHHSRVSPSTSQASASRNSMSSRPRSVSGGDTPKLKLPEVRTDQSAAVAVVTQPNDRFGALWQNLSAVEHAVGARYARVERELMVAADGSASVTGAASGKEGHRGR
ncbi:hypothetical protein ABB37_02403 [Leptomonas pyrrhocoris]|uniref:Uncharacterized protein n=1 Tax=Leptomonas pyrrhocoris TaxID=157538 RepID=A0A0N0DYQ3_LEPPY|nr:hypothetical protein ABB37_02403 [Leptomonas pyrrhocoris]KPA84428.1 hypothetical protein ABB37_02403 [Leptomonas pyrrhocoris]|eukprot:XP_015662867.1 hypothetical protein ABB37_02403 [Leptomonas pyrrhocoris]